MYTQPDGESRATDVNWIELDRSPHAIQFYSGDVFLLDSLSRFVSTALEAGDSCLVLATQAHLEGLAERLRAQGVDTNRAVNEQRYVALDAFQVLAKLMVDGKVNKSRFEEFFHQVVLPLKAAAESKLKRVALCGEVVSLLWADGKAEDAITLEHFWNEVAARDSFCLRCFYAIASFSDREQNELFLKLCAEHASIIPRANHIGTVARRVKEFELVSRAS
jgi:KaiC/GvpD/RAD55 family RecA-like ATPase